MSDETSQSLSAKRVAEAPMRPRCPGCDYDLTGTLDEPQQRCPECGRPWTIDELAQQHVADTLGPRRSRMPWLVWAFGPGLAAASILLVGFVLGSAILAILAMGAAGVVLVAGIVAWAREIVALLKGREMSGAGRALVGWLLVMSLLAANLMIVVILFVAVAMVVGAVAG